ncbi:MAG: rRNA maturation RNase YbeY [Actinomycetales bacterium]|nr:rRNA maturation RNase YbeY [Actinomycetales bacterium]
MDLVDTSGTASTDADALLRQAAFLLDRLHLDPDAELSIALVDEAEMTRLHVEWMDEPGSTDVLSFPMDDLAPGDPLGPRVTGVLGDVIICPAVAARQADQAGHGVNDELALLLTHGVLHLLGYDHAEPHEHERMFALQDSLLADWRSAQAES